MRKETVLLANLNCPSCAANLEKALSRMDGVRGAQVAFGTGSLELEYDERVVGPEDIERVAEGFGVSIVARL